MLSPVSSSSSTQGRVTHHAPTACVVGHVHVTRPGHSPSLLERATQHSVYLAGLAHPGALARPSLSPQPWADAPSSIHTFTHVQSKKRAPFPQSTVLRVPVGVQLAPLCNCALVRLADRLQPCNSICRNASHPMPNAACPPGIDFNTSMVAVCNSPANGALCTLLPRWSSAFTQSRPHCTCPFSNHCPSCSRHQLERVSPPLSHTHTYTLAPCFLLVIRWHLVINVADQ